MFSCFRYDELHSMYSFLLRFALIPCPGMLVKFFTSFNLILGSSLYSLKALDIGWVDKDSILHMILNNSFYL